MATTKTMKALRMQKSGGAPPTLSVEEVPLPSINGGQVLVKIHAASVQPADILNSKGGFPNTTFPRTIGKDFAGTVVEGPPELKGQQVFGTSGGTFSFTEDGAQAEYAVVTAGAVVKMPSTLSFAQAASVGTPWSTAAVALSRAGAKSGDVVMILGATGSVGSAAAQIAKSLGCKVLGVGRHGTEINSVSDPTLSTAIELSGGAGPNIVIDTVGDLSLTRAAIDVMAVDGRLSTISAPRQGGTHLSVDVFTLYRKQHHLIGCNTAAMPQVVLADLLRSLVPAFESGSLRVAEESSMTKLTLENALDAYNGKAKKAVIMFA